CRRSKTPAADLLLEPPEDRRVRQALALKLQVPASHELLGLLGQERQHLVDQPLGFPALQSGGPRQVVQKFFQVGRLGVAHATLSDSGWEGNYFARNRAKHPYQTYQRVPRVPPEGVAQRSGIP